MNAHEALAELRVRGHDVKITSDHDLSEPQLAVKPVGGAALSSGLRAYLSRHKPALIEALQRENTGDPTSGQQREIAELVRQGMLREIAEAEVFGVDHLQLPAEPEEASDWLPSCDRERVNRTAPRPEEEQKMSKEGRRLRRVKSRLSPDGLALVKGLEAEPNLPDGVSILATAAKQIRRLIEIDNIAVSGGESIYSAETLEVMVQDLTAIGDELGVRYLDSGVVI